MTEMRDALVAAAAEVSLQRPSGVAGLLAGLHRDPATANLPIEAVALPPVPEQRDGRLLLVALLAVPAGPPQRLHQPFGAVTWDPADGSVVELREWGATTPAWAPATAVETWSLPGGEAELRVVCDALDELVAGRSPELAERYRAAMPPEAINWYRALVPGFVERPGPADVPDTPELSAELGGWIREAARLAGDAQVPALATELELLAEQRIRPGYRIAVVGEFNHGKSTLVNRLVGQDVLATGPVPTTTAFLVVKAGVEMSDTVSDSGDRRLELPCKWLAELNAEIIDTPGTNESSEDRMADVRRAVTLSDGVLMAVAASSPLSRSEREFLQHEVLRRSVPFVAVVVGFLDQLTEQDQAAALASVRSKVSQLAPGTPVLPGPGLQGGQDELAALRRLIADYAARHENRRWRARKIATAVADVASAIADVATEAAAAAALDDAERARAIERERAKLARDTAVWDGLRVELDTRRRTVAGRVRNSLAGDAAVIVEALHHELLRAPDPKEYWERDVPYRLRRELAALTRKCETLVLSGMAADIDWLDGTLAERFAVAKGSARPTPGLVAPEPSLPDAEIADLRRRKLLTRIGAAGGTVAGYVLGGAVSFAMPPIAVAMAGGLTAAILAERSVRNATATQRDAVDQLLRQAVDAVVAEVADQTSARIRALYAEIIDEMVSRRTAWRTARLTTLQKPTRSAAADSTLAERASALAATIRDAVAGDRDRTPEES